MKLALIIFVRNAVLGKVKTRLAKTVGDEQALAVYKELLQYTHDITQLLQYDKYVFYADTIVQHDIWDNNIYYKILQTGNNLGDRMNAAFDVLFNRGYQQVCIIGSDCYELTTTIIQQAFYALQQCDVVIGPSADGGYYLLGLTGMQPLLFSDMEWSTGKVFKQTTDVCTALQVSYTLLKTLHDVDDEQDWRRYQTKRTSL